MKTRTHPGRDGSHLVGRIDPTDNVAWARHPPRFGDVAWLPATITMIDNTAPMAPTTMKIHPTLLMIQSC